jgi:ABC-type multidrug transport system fused ATPase/permease subunit
MKNNPYSNAFDPKQIEWETRNRLMRTGLISASVVVFILILSIVAFPLTTRLRETYPIGEAEKEVNWSLLEGISSLITVALVIGGVAFAFTEYIQSTVQQRRESAEAAFNIYKEVYEKLMNPEATAARRWLILNLPVRQPREDDQSFLQRTTQALNKMPEGYTGERPPGLDHLKDVLNTFDFIGFVAKHYWNMDQALVSWMSPSVTKVWERISLYVEDEAKRRNEPDFYQAAREFGRSCVQWREEHYPKSNIISAGT